MNATWEHRLLKLAGDLPHPATRPHFSYWAGDHSLEQAYKACEQVTAAHSKSFYMASGLLPEEKRSAVRALYAFCRTVDDIVDESTEANRVRALSRWREVVLSGRADENDPISVAWVDTLKRYHIPAHYALQLIDGVERDLFQARYEDFEDLATYCYGVASTVGLMSMYIVGFKSVEALPYALKLGVALQMTNILRDVGEDARRGRIYLPQDEMLSFGISEDDILNGHLSKNWQAFMQFQIARTAALYGEAWRGIRLLDRDGQLAIAAAAEFYSGILDDIEQHDYDVFSRRASLSAWGKITRIPGLWLKVRG